MAQISLESALAAYVRAEAETLKGGSSTLYIGAVTNKQLPTISSRVMSRLNVLVVGASIAGPTAAYWFARAGASVTVIERFPSLRTSGQAVDIRTVGVEVMRKMPGMEAAVRAKTTTLEGMSFVRDDGRPYGVIKATGDPEQQSIVSEFEIFRGEPWIGTLAAL